jgi:hypothetical protein
MAAKRVTLGEQRGAVRVFDARQVPIDLQTVARLLRSPDISATNTLPPGADGPPTLLIKMSRRPGRSKIVLIT